MQFLINTLQEALLSPHFNIRHKNGQASSYMALPAEVKYYFGYVGDLTPPVQNMV